jgi:hypothetical protein
MEAVPGQVKNEKSTSRKTDAIFIGVWLKWAIATVIGMLAALCLVAIPVISGPDLSQGEGAGLDGPVFKVGGFWPPVLFFMMGLLSALPQTWILSKIVKRSYLWLIATG